jgi:predicted transcriptional regulator
MADRDVHFGPLELDVLACLRARPDASVQEIADDLRRLGGGKQLAYTTVMTVLGRLHAKGVLARGKDGRLYRYSLAKGAARAERSVLQRVTRALLGPGTGRLRPILALLGDTADLSADDLRLLKAAVDERLKEREGASRPARASRDKEKT